MMKIEIMAAVVCCAVVALAAVVINLYFNAQMRCAAAGMDSIAVQGAVFCVDVEGHVWRPKKS